MSDHWKSLANQFGIPGPADPPKTQKPAERANTPTVAPPSIDTPAASLAPVVPPSQPPAPRSVPQPTVASPTVVSPTVGTTPVASTTSPVAASSESRPAGNRPARQRSSMWGDDADCVPDLPSPEPVKSVAAAPSVPEPTTRSAPPRPVDPLSAIVSIDRGPTVPGFDLPEDQSPGATKVPVRRSAWDALIGTLGIKTSAEAAAEKAAKASPPPPRPTPVAREPESREAFGRESAPRERGGRDVPSRDLPSKDPGSRDSRERRPSGSRSESGRRSEAADQRGTQPTAEGRYESRQRDPVSSGFGAGLIVSDDSASRTSGAVQSEGAADANDDRPRGRGRRGGSRRRGRGASGEREVNEASQADNDWELDPIDDDDDQLATSGLIEPVQTPRDRVRPDADPLDDNKDSTDRPRRSRRRGQRQLLSIDDVERGRLSDPAEPASRPATGRGEGPAGDRPRRREESSPRERQPRGERVEGGRSEVVRGESPRSERAPRSGRDRQGESSLPSAARAAGQRRGESPRNESLRGDDDFVDFDDEDAGSGFGSGLVAEAKSPASGEDDEPRTRPRRRRGRRGRGGAAREDRPGVDPAGEVDDASDAALELPAFDDDLEDDDEADRLRRRSRGGRSRSSSRRDPVAGDADASKPHDSEASPRGADFAIDIKARSVPTWLDTVGMLVDANIQRRSSNGGGNNGGGQRGSSPQGRGGRR